MKYARPNGFTLIELMIALVIVAILAAIALPSYQESVRKTRLSDGKSWIMQVSQAQERHFTSFSRYAATITGAPPGGLGLTRRDSEERNWSVDNAVTVNGTNTTFTITVRPANGHTDAKCPTLMLTNAGVKSPGTCW